MSDKMYTLEVTERELARVMFVMGNVNGLTGGESVYSQAYGILGLYGMDNDRQKVYNASYQALHEALDLGIIDYRRVQEEWEKALGVGKFKKSPVQQRIENLEKELDELKKLL